MSNVAKMSEKSNSSSKKIYAEIKSRKEVRKKWREEKLLKKAKKEMKKETVDEPKSVQKNDEVRKKLSTVSIAVAGSILDNAQSAQLRIYLAGQIARAACIYKIDEVVVFDDLGEITESEKKKVRIDEALGQARIACLQLARVLQYLECPQYLRKIIFPLHQDLQHAGLLNPLDAPHHLRQQDKCTYREGVVTNKPTKPGRGSFVNVGLFNDVMIDKVLTPGTRVTVQLPEEHINEKKIRAQVVTPRTPKLAGLYWGYSVRLASSLSDVFAKCPFKGGYDLAIGTSDKGKIIDQVPGKSLTYNHALIVFGGLSGLEAALELDPQLDIDDPSLLFNHYLNTCPIQGSRTIRTEEAILLSLAELRTKLSPNCPVSETAQFSSFSQKEHVEAE